MGSLFDPPHPNGCWSFDLSLVDFCFLRDLSTDSLGFDVYNLKGRVWEEFQTKWKHITGFFIADLPEGKGEENPENLNNLEMSPRDIEPSDKVPTKSSRNHLKGEDYIYIYPSFYLSFWITFLLFMK